MAVPWQVRRSEPDVAGDRRPPAVLLVTEDQVLADLARLALLPLRARLEVTSEVETALAKVGAGRVQAVLLDLFRPAVDPVALVGRFRRARGDAAALIVVSGLGLRQVVRAALAAGADDFLVKPVTGEALRRKVAAALRSSRVVM